jgi:hypothetical protein
MEGAAVEERSAASVSGSYSSVSIDLSPGLRRELADVR